MNALHEHIARDGFRLRGTSMSRVDGFSDVVFGFALTLIVVSLEVPHTYDELHQLLLGFFPFSICFVLFLVVWWTHFRFFRRYGLHDTATIAINSLLLLTVLFYVYPLKFLFTIAVTAAPPDHVFSHPEQQRELMVVYGLGFAAIYLCFTGLYANAWRLRKEMRFNPLEVSVTLAQLWYHFGIACIGLLTCVIACLLPPSRSGEAGYFFFAIMIWGFVHGRIARKRVRVARARTSLDELTAPAHSL
jgi:uncharacterized membrane protein